MPFSNTFSNFFSFVILTIPHKEHTIIFCSSLLSFVVSDCNDLYEFNSKNER